ncbi:MAG: hypothetical protein FWG42_12345 [Clostridiales bacterium]|nr:hypothetical protein [Clostridiales bacterium]
MKKLLTITLVLALVLASAVPAMAVPSYDSTVLVEITPDDKEIILSGDSVEVIYTVTVQNISKSGDLPQIVVTPLGDNTGTLAPSSAVKIINTSAVAFTFEVTYTEIGEYDFWVNIKNMQGGSGKWNYEFTSTAVTTTIIAPPPVEQLPEGFSINGDGLFITKNALGIGDFSPNGKELTVLIDGVSVDVNSDVNASSGGICIKYKTLKPGVYVIKNETSDLEFSFEIKKLDGYQSEINILG